MSDIHANIAQGKLTGIYGIPAPTDWPALGVDDPVELEIKAARQEIAKLPQAPYPSAASVVANHPGYLGYQVMTDPEYQNAVKYDLLMRKLDSIQRDQGWRFRDSPTAGGLTGGTYSPEPLKDRSFWASMWGTKERPGSQPLPPYRHRGFLATGQPMRNAFDMWMVPFSAVANTGVRPWYDLDKAAKEAPEVANKAFAGIPRALLAATDPNYKGEVNPAWAKERAFAERLPFDSPEMVMAHGDPGSLYRSAESNAPTGIVEGAQILGELGYPEHWSRDLLGMAAESLLDPASGYAAAGKGLGQAARAVTPATRNAALRHAAGGLASEAAPAAGMTALLEALRRAQEKR